MNMQSSRSHLIFEIRIETEHLEKRKKRTSSLVLIDLAGSERFRDAGTS
jgi:kinesin family protein 5